MDKKLSQRIAFIIFRILGIAVVGILFWILGFIIYNGIGVINWEFLTSAPTEGMTSGGIFPAIVGTMYLIIGSMIFVPASAGLLLASTVIQDICKDSVIIKKMLKG